MLNTKFGKHILLSTKNMCQGRRPARNCSYQLAAGVGDNKKQMLICATTRTARSKIFFRNAAHISRQV